MSMKCPHCRERIDVSHTLWHMWYRQDLRDRVIIQTGNELLADLISAPGAGGPVASTLKSIEEFVAAMCLAWHRGTLLSKDMERPAGTKNDHDSGAKDLRH